MSLTHSYLHAVNDCHPPCWRCSCTQSSCPSRQRPWVQSGFLVNLQLRDELACFQFGPRRLTRHPQALPLRFCAATPFGHGFRSVRLRVHGMALRGANDAAPLTLRSRVCNSPPAGHSRFVKRCMLLKTQIPGATLLRSLRNLAQTLAPQERRPARIGIPKNLQPLTGWQ